MDCIVLFSCSLKDLHSSKFCTLREIYQRFKYIHVLRLVLLFCYVAQSLDEKKCELWVSNLSLPIRMGKPSKLLPRQGSFEFWESGCIGVLLSRFVCGHLEH